ncbi:MAG: anaerobic carbon-monoxide dehydrogenase catalytic subunit, partial [Acetobacteraceae bacterium]|nr:anaerobic carbon-monoxide dehydrogenase catalytic subunit [Acetobacteraceae bacterium]
APDYRIKDPEKLARVAARLGIETDGKDPAALAREVAQKAIADFTRFEEEPCAFLTSTIVEGRRRKFVHCDIAPSSIDRAIAEVIAQSTMGMDADPVNLIFGGLKCALADYTGMHIATDLSDVLLGTPHPVVTEANLGVIDPECVNIATHGHNPVLSEMVVEAARALSAEAQAAGAKGIKVMGICCTGNELLMRQGVPLAANQAAQELAVMTGAIDAVVMDVQCFIPSLRPLAECFHTRLITTDPRAKIPGSYHIEFNEHHALDLAKEMVRLAIEAYRRRDGNRVFIPQHKSRVVAGFSLEALLKIFAAVSPERPVRALTGAITEGRLKGVCLFAGCNNLRVPQDSSHLTVARELLKNDVFLLATGCSAGAFAKAGWLDPAAVGELCGPGLQGFLQELGQASGISPGLPPIFHMGSCVDNTRASDLCMAMADDLGVDVPKVPFAASAPENMHEKAISIGSWAVAMGLPVHVGAMPPIEGSALVYGIGTQIAHDVYGGHFLLEEDPQEGAKKLLDALEYRTWKLKVHRAAAQKYGTALASGW